ncbi:MAG: rod shape-determining protein MreD [Actinomycetota bacterium]|jgi:rod shape-determining protein MreD
MRSVRIAVIATLLYLAGIIESTWFTMISLPGLVPPLAFVLVMSFAIRRSPASAAFLGFAAGGLLDLIPPTSTPLGMSAFSMAIVGFSMSLIRPYLEGSLSLPILAISIAAISDMFIKIIVASFMGVTQSFTSDFFVNFFSLGLYAAMLATFVLPFSIWIDSRIVVKQKTILYR